jgi:hypothetical protein
VLLPQGRAAGAGAAHRRATARVLDAIGIGWCRTAVVAAALHFHLDDQPWRSTACARTSTHSGRCWKAGGRSVVSNASGCGAMLADYARHLGDPAYADKAARVGAAMRDLSALMPRSRRGSPAASHRVPASSPSTRRARCSTD